MGYFRLPAVRGAVLGMSCAVLVGLLTELPRMRGLEEWFHDGQFAWRGTRSTKAKVVIVGLDDDSLGSFDKPAAFLSPELAEVARYLHAQGAKAIGIDFMVPERLATLPEIETPGGLGDAAPLGEAAAKIGTVVFPCTLGAGAVTRPVPQWRLAEFQELLRAQVPSVPLHSGFVDLTEDDDQFVRRQTLLVRRGSAAVPHFALALFARAAGKAIEWDNRASQLKVGGEIIPLDAEQKLRINFVGPPESYPVLSFRRVLELSRAGTALPNIAGASVIVGITARGQQDYHATPYANRFAQTFGSRGAGLMSGSELHAHILATLQDRFFIRTPSFLARWPWLLAVGALLGWGFMRLNLELGLLAAIVHHIGWRVLALTAFVVAGWRMQILPMIALGAVTYGLSFVLRWRSMRRMLGVVNSEAIARALENDPRRLDPGGELRELTVLFADIRSFTPFAEAHSPQVVVALLNAYFGTIVPLLEAEGGVVNHYMGDGVMVLFGAPVWCPDHALRAVRAAVAAVRAVRAEASTWGSLGFRNMKIGIGIHTGPALLGCVGSARRLDYTAIGDTINAAARIEKENKRLHSEILISAVTFEELPAAERIRLGCDERPEPAALTGKLESTILHRVNI